MPVGVPGESPDRLWRTALHDFNNLLAGIQGVLDLSDPSQPLSARNRSRLEATLEEGRTLVAMSRALALDRVPDPGPLSWPEWREGLLRRLEPLSVLFACPVSVEPSGPVGGAWPAPLLQDWAAAFSRQLLPWIAPGPLRIEAEADEAGWTLRWADAPPLPPALRPDPAEDVGFNLTALWLRAMTARLRVALEDQGGILVARMPCAS